MKRIAILGLGEVGKTLAMQLLAERQLRYHLVVMDPDANVIGTFLDLAHAATLRGHRISWNNTSALRQAEVVFHTAGAKVPPGSDRREVLAESLRITRDLFSPRLFQNDPWIIVLANPVDLVAQACHSFLENAAYKVMGTGTLLDAVRWKYYLAQHFQIPASKVDAWVLGEHGRTMVPAYSLSTIDGKPLVESESIKPAFSQTLEAAATIKATAGATRFGVVQCALEILHGLQNPEGQRTLASVQLTAPYAHRLGCEPLFLSLPVRMMPGKGPVVQWENLNEKEWIGLQHSALELTALGKVLRI